MQVKNPGGPGKRIELVDGAGKQKGSHHKDDRTLTQQLRDQEEAMVARKADLDRIRTEKDPEKIIELASVGSRVRILDGQGQVIRGCEEKLAAIDNPNTPTIFLLYLYTYKNPTYDSVERVIGLSDYPKPYVTDEIRAAAEQVLSKRNWKLGSYECEKLTEGEILFYETLLAGMEARYELVHCERDRTSQLGIVSSKLINTFGKSTVLFLF